ERYGLQIEAQWTGKIEKARDEIAEAIDFGGDVAGELGGERFGFTQARIQHLGGAFDDAERIADFVSEAGGELTQGGEAFGAAGLLLRALEEPIGFGELLGEELVALGLAAILDGEAIHDDGGEKEKEIAADEFGDSAFSEDVILQDGQQIRAVG